MITNNASKTTACRQSGGFSLVELLVSVAIIATSLVYMIGIFTTGMNANRKSVDLTAGTLVAESIISHELYGILADTSLKTSFFKQKHTGASPFVSGTETIANTKFTYKMYVNDVEGFKEAGNAMKKVDVQVWWFQHDPDENSEHSKSTSQVEGRDINGNVRDFRNRYGVVSVGLTRLINQQSKL